MERHLNFFFSKKSIRVIYRFHFLDVEPYLYIFFSKKSMKVIYRFHLLDMEPHLPLVGGLPRLLHRLHLHLKPCRQVIVIVIAIGIAIVIVFVVVFVIVIVIIFVTTFFSTGPTWAPQLPRLQSWAPSQSTWWERWSLRYDHYDQYIINLGRCWT